MTFFAGWEEWTLTSLSVAEGLNAVSIVARLDFNGGSVLLMGDTIGRRLNDADPAACKDAEEVLRARHDAGTINLHANVVIAAHHGGDNGSAACIVSRTNPDFVVFSAGHDHQHPRHEAATRWLQAPNVTILRTDRGDDEPPEPSQTTSPEWKVGNVTPGCKDPRGDDAIEIVIRASGVVEVAYRGPDGACL